MQAAEHHPAALRSLGGEAPHSPSLGGDASPAGALLFDEIERTRRFLVLLLLVVIAIAAALPLLGGHPGARTLFAVALGCAAAVVLWLISAFRRPDRFTSARLSVGSALLALCGFAGVLYFGAFSPAPAMFVLGLYFYSLGGGLASAAAIYAGCAALQALLALLVLTGRVPELGLIRADALTGRQQLIVQVLVQLLYLAAFITARFSRRTALAALSRLELAVRQVAERDALLREARADLDRALRVGGPGRYTDQQLGSYRLGVLLGRGGMGEVYRAERVDSGEPAAVKLLAARSADNPTHVARFLREVRAIASIRERHVVSVLEVGTTEGEVPYFAMELLEGHDLAMILRKRRRLSPIDVVAMVDQVGRGLAAAAAAGIVHRDIKPQNLFFARVGPSERIWKILDFGVSKVGDRAATLTGDQIVGTPGYMPPEQARGAEIDHRADLYSLAAIAYRALTGQPPFWGKDVAATLYEVVHEMPARPSAIADLPPDVDLTLAIALAKSPADRFATAAELTAALATAAAGGIDPGVRARGEALLARAPWRRQP